MDVDQLASNLFHDLQSHGRVVDESTAFLLRVEFTAKDALGLKVEVIFLKQGLQVFVIQCKLGFHHAFLVLVVEHACVGTVAQGKTQCAEQDGLARASFAGNDIETSLKTDTQFVNQGVITDVQLLEH